MATTRKGGRSARSAMAAAQQQRRTSDIQAPGRAKARSIAQGAREGKRPGFPKAASKAYQGGMMASLRAQRDKGGRINVAAAHRKGQERHTQVYGGAAGKRAGEDRRSGSDRRAG